MSFVAPWPGRKLKKKQKMPSQKLRVRKKKRVCGQELIVSEKKKLLSFKKLLVFFFVSPGQ